MEDSRYLTKEQNDIRFGNRRRIAKQSFYIFSTCIVSLLGLGMVSDAMAARVASMQWLMTVAGGLWGTLILGYYAAATYEQTGGRAGAQQGPSRGVGKGK